jgi:hypothetical protein
MGYDETFPVMADVLGLGYAALVAIGGIIGYVKAGVLLVDLATRLSLSFQAVCRPCWPDSRSEDSPRTPRTLAITRFFLVCPCLDFHVNDSSFEVSVLCCSSSWVRASTTVAR